MKLRRVTAGCLLGAALVLSSCGTPADPAPAADAPAGFSLGSLWPAPPGGDVVGEGTVLDDGSGPELCLGGVMESYPPQCGGIPLEGWDWDGVDGAEEAPGVTWGAYAVQGTYDGDTLALTQPPILLALYDPMAPSDPGPGDGGTATAAELAAIQEGLPDRLGADLLSSTTTAGRLEVQVVWDDGTWQDAADDDYGEGTVLIRSALREVG
ncbi:hypothetical protein AB3M83_09435 [Microbacterium sp. 179-B 1A2 NHS]|uniref:hypothetical protein n=1 Tax=Microbacterium sp. 179-B 1A2 NHS TaxID=3142383 RepID=UPI0039A10D97